MADTRTRSWRRLGETTIGIAAEKDGTYGAFAAETLVGPSASLASPIFNQGSGAVDRAHATVEALTSDVKALELSIGNDIATRVAAQRTIVEESQRRQNYMLIGALDLLTAKQHQYEGYEALRDYWLAYVELVRATGGQYPGSKSGSDELRMSR